MAKKTQTPEAAKDQLWTQLDRHRVGMLSVHGSRQHPQPMSLFADRESGTIRFLTSLDTDLVSDIGAGATGQLTLLDDSKGYYASLRGPMKVTSDEATIRDLWSVMAAAWFEHGEDDPKIRVIELEPEEAAVWANESNAVLVGLKLLQAGMSEGESEPDVGVHHVLKLAS